MQDAIDRWNVVERGAANVPGEMHGACDSVAGENFLCATVTRKTAIARLSVECQGEQDGGNIKCKTEPADTL